MNSVLPSNPLFAPHLHENPRHSPPRSDFYTTTPVVMSGRKRKASDEPDDRMSTSPIASPTTRTRALPAPLQPRTKRSRTASTPGRLLDIPRLLETLTKADLQNLISEICSANPTIAHEVVSRAPRPTLDSVLSVLRTYETTMKEAFPFGNRPESDYTYNRVRVPLAALLSALSDFTPQFLPPVESQFSVSLGYLDAATEILHRIPQFDTFGHNAGRYEAYEEIAAAWGIVIREAMKRGGGIQLQLGSWDTKIQRHNQLSGGRLAAAVEELQKGLGWMGSGGGSSSRMGTGLGDAVADERAQIRQQLMSGTYGAGVGVGPGRRW